MVSAFFLSGCTEEFIQALNTPTQSNSGHYGSNTPSSASRYNPRHVEQLENAVNNGNSALNSIIYGDGATDFWNLQEKAYFHYLDRGLSPADAKEAANQYAAKQLMNSQN